MISNADHLFKHHLCIFFGEMSVQVLCPFFNQVDLAGVHCMFWLLIAYQRDDLQVLSSHL
jgi:hypothetical protein